MFLPIIATRLYDKSINISVSKFERINRLKFENIALKSI